MKKIKLMSILAAAVMSVSMLFSTVPVSADDNIAETSDKIYNLEELFAMSDEEFFALEYAKDYYGDIKGDAERVSQVFDIIEYGGISGSLMRSVLDENVNYTVNITEMEIEELLGDTVKYEIISPIFRDPDYLMDNSLFYWHIFSLYFPEYDLYSQSDNITHKEIIEFTKCWYCINQVFEIYYSGFGSALSSAPSNEQIIKGDVNVDKKIDLTDVDYMEKGLSGELKLTELQMKIADVNGDGTFDELDVEKLKADIIANTEPTTQDITVPADAMPTKYGDVNGDSRVDIADVVALNLFMLDSETHSLTDTQLANSDCVKDNVINASDGSLLLNFVSMIIDESKLGE